jgi:hypothetical protein
VFFIVGSARSGTTLLRLMLNAHPDVAVPPESRFITELWKGQEEVDVQDFLSRLESHRLFRAWDLPIEAVRQQVGVRERAPYREAILAAYRAFGTRLGKSILGDKTPRYVEHIPFLGRLFPESRFVHLVRDGRNVAMSYADVPFGPKTVARVASLWKGRVGMGLTAGRALGRGRYLELHYEDLIEDPSGEIQTLSEFLDIRFDPSMLDYTERARDSVLARAARYNPHLTEKPRADVRSWQETMPPLQAEIFEAVAGNILTELGYERSYPQPSVAARLAAGAGRIGLPVNRLKRSRD